MPVRVRSWSERSERIGPTRGPHLFAAGGPVLEDRVDDDGLFAAGADRDEVDRALEQGFDALDEGLRLEGKVVERADAGGRGLPARELFVDWLDAFQGGFARWEGGDYLAIELVAGADLDGFHVVE